MGFVAVPSAAGRGVSPMTLTAHNATETPLKLVPASGQTAPVLDYEQAAAADGTPVALAHVAGNDAYTLDDFGNGYFRGNVNVRLNLFADRVYSTNDGGTTQTASMAPDGTVTGTAFVGVTFLGLADLAATPANGQLCVYNISTGKLDPVDRADVTIFSAVADAKSAPGTTVNVGGPIPANMVGQVERFKVPTEENPSPGAAAWVTFGTAVTPGLFAPATQLSVQGPGDVYEADGLASGQLVAGTQLTGTVAVASTAAGTNLIRFVYRVALWRAAP